MEERLQKVLARAGIASRRACEEMIRAGRVTVNGSVAHLGQKVEPARDRVQLDGEPVALAPSSPIYIAVNKPRGVLSTTKDERGRRTVRDLVPIPGHLFLVGRLDRASEGLVLLTNDGDLTNRLTHPRFQHTKEYRVLVQGMLDDGALAKWRRGVMLDGEMTAPADASVLGYTEQGTWLQVVLREGRNRLIRRVAEALGHPVLRLVRVRIGPVHLGDLRPRRWRRLTARELNRLETLVRGRRE
jgi:pseudouridine synthase